MKEIVHDFYQDLYSVEHTDSALQNQVLALDREGLSNEQRKSFEGLLTFSESIKALKEMAN